VHVQEPLEQFVNEQFAPISHCSAQWPLEQSRMHVDPAAHAVRQPPDEQAMVQVAPLGHEVLHPPLVQSIEQLPLPQYVRQ
jgi:hypothetical protein